MGSSSRLNLQHMRFSWFLVYFFVFVLWSPPLKEIIEDYCGQAKASPQTDLDCGGQRHFLKSYNARADFKQNVGTFLAFLCSSNWNEWYVSKRRSKGPGVEFKVRGMSHVNLHVNLQRRICISYIFHIISLHGKTSAQQIDLAPIAWFHGSVGRASHRYRGGHGFESRWSPGIFQASSFQLLTLEIYCDDHSSLSVSIITTIIVMFTKTTTNYKSMYRS